MNMQTGVRQFFRGGVAASAMMIALSLGGIAAAQTAPAAGASPDDEADSEVVIVTARRQNETLIETPTSVTAFGIEAIERLQIDSIDDIARNTPGLSFSRAFGRSSERPVIRGQANVLANVQFGVESGTAYFVDGIYFPGTISSLDINEVQRVEVIRGPQSALYGRNTYAGAVNFITRGRARETGGRVGVRVGSHGERNFNATFESPIGDIGSMRFSARHSNYDGEYTNTVTGKLVGDESTTAIAGTVELDLTENLNVRVRASANEDRDGPLALFLQPASMNNCMPGRRSLAFWPASGSTNQNQYYCGVIRPGQVALNTDAVAGPLPLVPGVPTTGHFGNVYDTRDGTPFDGIARDLTLVTAQVRWDLGGSGYMLNFSTGHRWEDEMFGADSDHSSVNASYSTTTGGFFANTTRDDVHDASYELKISSPDDRRFRWMLGAFTYKQENDGYNITFLDPAGSSIRADYGLVENTAYFGMVELDITPTLTATLEGRSATENKRTTQFNTANGAITYDRTAEFDNFTPRAILRWRPSEDLTVYGIYSEGVKPGGLNGIAGLNVGRPEYLQETSVNYEWGVKTQLFDRRLAINYSGYYIEAENVQLTTAIPIGSALNSIATNQGNGQIKGLELDATWRPGGGFTLGGTYAWTVPEFTSGCDDDQWTLTSGGGLIAFIPPTAPAGTAPIATNPNGRGDCSIVGNRYPLTSEHQASINFDWRPGISVAGGNLFASGDVSYESSKFVQVHNLAETGDATLVGARFGLEGENWSLAFFGRNLTDEDSIVIATRWLQTPYFTFISPTANTAASGFSRATPRAFFGTLRRGRALGVELKYEF